MAASPIAARFGAVPDQPLARGDEARARRRRSREPHVAPINDLLREAGHELGRSLPIADPAYAGVRASVVLLARSCGKGAADTGITSWDTPDQSARNLRALLRESALDPADAALLNALPAPPLDRRGRLREPTAREQRLAREKLPAFLALFERASVVVALGDDAHGLAERAIERSGRPRFSLIHAPNPSPRVVRVSEKGLNRHASALLNALDEAAHASA